jgi:ABC-type Fe3+ transport system permease subunit
VALASGAVLASTYRWEGQLTASAVVAAGLVAVTVAGVAQARRMTRLRQDALRGPGSAEFTAKVRRGARSAAALRAAIAALSLALLVLGAVIAT